MQKKQATGLDTLMMLPVYVSIFSLICQFFLPWISIPVLKYSRLKTAYTVFDIDSCIVSFQQCILKGRRLNMPPLTQEQINVMHIIGVAAAVAATVMCVLLAACVVSVLMRREKSRRIVRVTFSFHLLYTMALFGLVVAANIFINRQMGRPVTFANMTINSVAQLTSWVYGQMLLSLGMLIFGNRLLSVREAEDRELYVSRTVHEDQRMGKRTKLALVLLVVAIPLVVFFGIYFLNDRSNVFIGLCIVCLAMLPFAMVFEDRRPQARELLLIAVISAIAVAGRAAFFMVPQFKPVTAIVIIAGAGLGAEAGFLTGAVSGFASNFFYGQGPWTPWQMFAYGIIGFLAGIIFRRRQVKNRKLHQLALCAYGGISAFVIYGLIMDISALLSVATELTWQMLATKIATGISFNFVHGIATVVFLWFLAEPMERKLNRIKKKYGIMQV